MDTCLDTYVSTIDLMIVFVSAIAEHGKPEWAAHVFVRLFSTFDDPMSCYLSLHHLLDYHLPRNDSWRLEAAVTTVCNRPRQMATQCVDTICQRFIFVDATSAPTSTDNATDETAMNNGEEEDGDIGDDSPGTYHAFGEQAGCK
jgi:hypothetical protein